MKEQNAIFITKRLFFVRQKLTGTMKILPKSAKYPVSINLKSFCKNKQVIFNQIFIKGSSCGLNFCKTQFLILQKNTILTRKSTLKTHLLVILV
ncbi:MAG: hypothetical protein IKL77_06290 [Clostridia bacterium]|nr:hypothetical protein [Clostridia bacterium]MBR6688340.1 hypothetical protein [Clostridia bacterium]